MHQTRRCSAGHHFGTPIAAALISDACVGRTIDGPSPVAVRPPPPPLTLSPALTNRRNGRQQRTTRRQAAGTSRKQHAHVRGLVWSAEEGPGSAARTPLPLPLRTTPALLWQHRKVWGRTCLPRGSYTCPHISRSHKQPCLGSGSRRRVCGSVGATWVLRLCLLHERDTLGVGQRAAVLQRASFWHANRCCPHN